MNYIVLDLEWNQAANKKNRYAKILPFEIIEIGAVKLNDSFQIIDTFQEVIRPVVYPKIHHISREVTGFTSADLQQGGHFPEVLKRFLTWCSSSEYRFCTWGPLDLTELQRNMNYYKIPLFPSPLFFYDIQEVFSIINGANTNRRSLEYAVEFYEIEKKKDFHRALSDAYYTALIMAAMGAEKILPNDTVDTYQQPAGPDDEIYMRYDTHSRYISRTFPSRHEVMENSEVLSTRCCICDRRLRKKLRWFSDNSKNYYCLALCKNHGYQSGKLHIKKNDKDRYYAIKELTMTDSEGAAALYEKRVDYTKKHRTKYRQKASAAK